MRNLFPLTISAADWDDPAAVALRDAQQDELRKLYDGGSEPGIAPSRHDVTVFLIGRGENGRPVGCGGLRAIDDRSGEIKRMYVVPGLRGRGVARQLLDGLERAAGHLGWTRLLLETGPRQQAALTLYERAGYVRIPNFGHYVDDEWSICLAKGLKA